MSDKENPNFSATQDTSPSNHHASYWSSVVPQRLEAHKRLLALEKAADDEIRTGMFIPGNRRTAAPSEIRAILRKPSGEYSDAPPVGQRCYDLSQENDVVPNFRDLARGRVSPRSVKFQTGERTNFTSASPSKKDRRDAESRGSRPHHTSNNRHFR